MNLRRVENRWNASLEMTWAAALLVAATPVWSDGIGGFRSFCVGSCSPPPYTHTTSLQSPVAYPLNLSFSVKFDDVVLNDGAGFTFLDLRDDEDEELLRITIEQDPEASLDVWFLRLDYQLPGGLQGTLDLGEAEKGADCFRVQWTPITLEDPFGSEIRVLRSKADQAFETGGVAITGEPVLVRQGVLGYQGAPSGTVLISEARIDEECEVIIEP